VALGPNVRAKIVRFFGENIEVSLDHHGFGDRFLDFIPKE
jgi:hypothetical protein